MDTKKISNILDCTKLECPEPVLRCKKILAEQKLQSLIVLADNIPARENITRFLTTKGYSITAKLQDELWHIIASLQNTEEENQGALSPAAETATSLYTLKQAHEKKILVLITSDLLGTGDQQLGEKLLLNFLKTIPEMGQELWRIILLNSAVKLSVAGHPALPLLQKLEAEGTTILVCGTCLEYYKILDNKQVGQTTNMLDVVTSLQLADSVIRP